MPSQVTPNRHNLFSGLLPARRIWLKNLAAKLRNKGISLFGVNIRIFISRISSQKGASYVAEKVLHKAMVGHVNSMLRKHPVLKEFYHSSVEHHFASTRALFDFYNNYLPVINQASREAYLRTLLEKLKASVEDEAFSNQITIQISKSNLREGVIDRAARLLDHPLDIPAPEQETLRRDIKQHEEKYGAAIITDYYHRKLDLTGIDVRGNSLVEYFSNHTELISSKRVLHFSPNRVLDRWFKANAKKLSMDYKTSNLVPGCDFVLDLCNLDLGGEQFDMVIIHRVFEHIHDDQTAIQECFRIIKKGGIMNVSVPQSMHQPTVSWDIQDQSHHEHVRQYGFDFEKKLEEAGFRVELVPDLLKKEMQNHVRDNTYPMRFYNCFKS